MMEVQCPHCGHVNQDLMQTGREISECGKCQQSFVLPLSNRPKILHAMSEPQLGLRGIQRGLSNGPTDVAIGTSGGIALVLTGLFYLVVITPLRDSYVGQLFGARGWVPYVVTLFACWASVMLVLKYRAYRHQLTALELDLLPHSFGSKITPANAHVFSSYLQNLDTNGPPSYLVRRLRWAIRHFRSRGNAQELASQLSERARADADALDSSYSMLRVFVWAIPILGFIGTVLGIGESVSSFSSAVAGAADLDVMKESIGSVTTGLGVAFDTTLLALVMSILVMFPTSALQKAEEGVLAHSDEYCDEHLLCRIDDTPEADSSQPAAPEVYAEEATAELGQVIDTLGKLENRISRLEPKRRGA